MWGGERDIYIGMILAIYKSFPSHATGLEENFDREQGNLINKANCLATLLNLMGTFFVVRF